MFYSKTTQSTKHNLNPSGNFGDKIRAHIKIDYLAIMSSFYKICANKAQILPRSSSRLCAIYHEI
jgi:hypothetical protein